jgi:uncharacterized protein (DUF39 family)
VLDEEIAATLALTDADLTATIYDYGVQRRSRPSLGTVSYAELRSGCIEVEGKRVPTGPISSLPKARAIAAELKRWVAEAGFTLSAPAQLFPQVGSQTTKPLEIRTGEAI